MSEITIKLDQEAAEDFVSDSQFGAAAFAEVQRSIRAALDTQEVPPQPLQPIDDKVEAFRKRFFERTGERLQHTAVVEGLRAALGGEAVGPVREEHHWGPLTVYLKDGEAHIWPDPFRAPHSFDTPATTYWPEANRRSAQEWWEIAQFWHKRWEDAEAKRQPEDESTDGDPLASHQSIRNSHDRVGQPEDERESTEEAEALEAVRRAVDTIDDWGAENADESKAEGDVADERYKAFALAASFLRSKLPLATSGGER